MTVRVLLVLVLVATAIVAALLPATRRWHRAGASTVGVLALAGAVLVALTTWSDARVSDDELRDAADHAADTLNGVPGVVSQQRLAATVSDRLGHDVFADPAGSTAEQSAYELVLADDDDSPSVCVVVARSPGTDTSVESSSVAIDDDGCG